MFSVAKAKRQLQSTQAERRLTRRFEKGIYFLICHLDFIDIIVFQQHEVREKPLPFFVQKILQKHYKFRNRSNSVEWKSGVFVEKNRLK